MLQANDEVGRYRLIEPLGSGGFGTVWLGSALDGSRDVAIKILHANLVDFRATPKGPSVAERFIAEARIIQSLEYPGFVRIYDCIEEPERGVVAYVMECLEGRDLTKTLQSITLPTLLEVIAQTAETLGFLHSHGIIHRDVKGSNIFICNPNRPNGMYQVKLIDFGIAKELHAEAMLESTATGYFLGTVRTMAPECFGRWTEDGASLTAAVDQWSLGVTLYYFLSGRMPFEEDSLVRVITRIESGEPPEIRLMKRFGYAATPPELVAVVRRCMAKDPNDRFRTMDRLAAALRKIANNLLPPPSDPTVFDPMLARTVPDSRTPEGAHLAEARQIALQMRAERQEAEQATVDPLAKTHRSEPVSPEAQATVLDHKKVSKAELLEIANTVPTEPATVNDAKAQIADAATLASYPPPVPGVPASAITGITKAPQPLTGPLVIDRGELDTAIMPKAEAEEAQAYARDDTLIRPAADEGTAATLLKLRIPTGPTPGPEEPTVPPDVTSRADTQPVAPRTVPSEQRSPQIRVPTEPLALEPEPSGKRTVVLVGLIVLALALLIFVALNLR